MAPRIKQIIDSLLDAMEAASQAADLVQAFALPMPSLIMGELFGVPKEELRLFQRAAHLQVDARTSREEAREGGRVVANAIMLIVGGHDTTTSMLALGNLVLLRNPDQLAIIRDTDDPARVASGVEELLRYLSVAHSGRRRVATETIKIGNQLIRAGEGVIVASDSGNRDPSVFDDPERLDFDLSEVREHMAFGHGTHACIGQNLVRTELQIAFPALLRRFPNLHTTLSDEEISFREHAVIYGVRDLPVTW